MTASAPPNVEPVEALAGRKRFHPLWVAIKAAISIGLIAFVLWKLDFGAVLDKSRHLPGALILSVVSIFVVQNYIAGCRWWLILRHHHLDVGLLTAVRICFIGAFFNQLLPSSIGGDVARAWYVHRSGYGKNISVVTVLSDRIYGMLTLACLAILSFPILVYYSIGNAPLIGAGILIMAASAALLAAFWLDRLPEWVPRRPVIRQLGSLSSATRAVMKDRRAVGPLLGLSLVIHGITILAVVILLKAALPAPNLALCAALVPVIMLLAMIPVSIAGWGVRESVMICGLSLAGVGPEAALMVSIMVGLSLAAVGLLGALTWLARFDGRGPRQPIS